MKTTRILLALALGMALAHSAKAQGFPLRDSYQGRVRLYDKQLGYGYIVEEITETDIFVHVGDLIDEIERGDRVVFTVHRGRIGPRAENVLIIRPAGGVGVPYSPPPARRYWVQEDESVWLSPVATR